MRQILTGYVAARRWRRNRPVHFTVNLNRVAVCHAELSLKMLLFTSWNHSFSDADVLWCSFHNKLSSITSVHTQQGEVHEIILVASILCCNTASCHLIGWEYRFPRFMAPPTFQLFHQWALLGDAKTPRRRLGDICLSKGTSYRTESCDCICGRAFETHLPPVHAARGMLSHITVSSSYFKNGLTPR